LSLVADRPLTGSDGPNFLKGKWAFTLAAVVLVAVALFMMFGGSEESRKFALNSWMYGYMFWLLLTMGALGLTLLHNMIRSSWTLPVLRIFEAGSSWQMFVALALGFLPIALNMPMVYEWADPSHVAGDTVLLHKAAYLNPNAFFIRFAIFFSFMACVSAGLRASTQRQDRTQDVNETQFRVNWAAPGFLAFFLVATFLLTDLGMSLTPHWSSTIYPLWLSIGGAQTALSLAIVLVCTNAKRAPYSDVMSPALTKDLGNMMFVLTMLWGYTSVSQLIILWNGNLPEFSSFYAHRSGDAKLGWNVIGASTILGCFFIPFVTLLSPRIKRYPDRLANIAGMIFVFRIVDVFWQIGAAIPHRAHDLAIPTPGDIVGFFAMGAVWFAVMIHQAEKARLVPTYDTRLQEAKANAH
jgi:hypothetical protein